MEIANFETGVRERALNEALVRADISGSFEEYFAIFEEHYANNVEVLSDSNQESFVGKDKIRPLLYSFLVPLHVMAEIGGMSVVLKYTTIRGDMQNEHHSEWTLELIGVSGRRVVVKWSSARRWSGSKVVYERQSEHRQTGEPLAFGDLDFGGTLSRELIAAKPS